MIHFERSLEIDATPDAVWAVLGRFMHIDEFAPLIASVDALTTGEDGLGSKRRNNFANGTSLVEEVTAWKPGEGFTVKLEPMLEEYYQFRGWDEKGVPKATKLKELELAKLT